jgi:hypothetical protein
LVQITLAIAAARRASRVDFPRVSRAMMLHFTVAIDGPSISTGCSD